VVAEAISTALRNGSRFECVVFAVLDRRPGTPTDAAFAGALSPRSTSAVT